MTNTVRFKDYICNIQLGKYQNNALAIKLVSAVTNLDKDLYEGEPIATATVNVDTISLTPDEVIIKSYSENEGMLEALQNEGYIGAAKPVSIGHVNVYVAQKTDKLKKLENDSISPSRKNKM